MSKLTKEGLTNFLDTFSDSIDKENVELYKKLIKNAPMLNFSLDSYEEFFYAVLYPFDKFVEGLIRSEICNNDDIIFIYKNSNFIEHHFDMVIESREGGCCCADKSRTIIRSLIRHFRTDTEIVFDYGQEYTYQLPETVFTKHRDIVSFYEAIKALYYGNSIEYLKCLKEIMIDKKGGGKK